jgi:tape measure domain-containing protein
MASGIRVELELVDQSFTTRMVHAGETVNQFNQNLGNTAQSVRMAQEQTQGFIGAFRDISVSVGLASMAIGYMHEAVSAIVKPIIDVNANMEKMGVLLRGMSNAADPVREAADQLAYMRNVAMQAPFSLAAISDTFVKLKSTGIDPMKGSLTALTDAIATFGGNDQELKRVTIAIQQMSGKGVIQMEELRQQLGEAIPRATELMARGMGVSISELIQKVGKGTVDAKAALASFFTELNRTFGGAGLQQAETFNGMLVKTETLMQNLALTTGAAGEEGGFFAQLKSQLADFNRFLASTPAANIATALGQGLDSAIRSIRSAITWLVDFQTQIVRTGEILAYAFGAKIALSGLMALGGWITQTIAQFNALRLSIQAAGVSIEMNNIAAGIGRLGLAGQGISGVTAAMRNLGAVATVVGVGMTTLSGIILPLGLLIAGLALQFNLFSNEAKDAAASLNNFTAASKKTLDLSRQRLVQMDDEIQKLTKMRDYVQADPSRSALFGYTKQSDAVESLNARIATLQQQRVDLEKLINVKSEEAAADHASQMADIQMKAIQTEQSAIRQDYNQRASDEAKNYDTMKAKVIAEHGDSQALAKSHQATMKQIQIETDQQLVDLLERRVQKAKEIVETGNNEQVAAAKIVTQRLLEQLNQQRQQLEQDKTTLPGIKETQKEPDAVKMLQSIQERIDTVKAKIHELNAELAGGDAKGTELLEKWKASMAAKGFIVPDTEDLKKAEAELQQLGEQQFKLQEQLKAQKKANEEEDSRNRKLATLDEQSQEILRRQAAGETFKLSASYETELGKLITQNNKLREAFAKGDITAEQLKKALDQQQQIETKMKANEVSINIQTEQEKIKELKRSLMTQSEANEQYYQDEKSRLEKLLALDTSTGEQRANNEKIVQEKIGLLREQYYQKNPIVKELKQWSDTQTMISTAAATWLNDFSDKMADFLTTGKADWASFAQSVVKSLAKIGTQMAISGLFNLAGGSSTFGNLFSGLKFHTGGIVGQDSSPMAVNPAVFIGAQRFHGGGFPGLSDDEVPAILKKGEQVGYPAQLAQQYGSGGQVIHISSPITINGSAGTAEQNKDLADRMSDAMNRNVRNIIGDELQKQLRPGGVLNGPRYRR